MCTCLVFLTFYSLQLTVVEDSYCLVWPHGSTPLTPLSLPVQPPPPGLSAPVNSTCKVKLPVFVQSSDYGPVFVTLSNYIFIPGRTESVIQAQTPKSCKEQIGMFCIPVKILNYLILLHTVLVKPLSG